MERIREYIVLILCFFAEIGMGFQFIKPNYFFNSSMIIAGTNFTVARAVLLINMFGMLVFAMSVFKGNINGGLHRAYFIMAIYAAAMIVFAIVPRQYASALEKEELELNSLLYLITMIMIIALFSVLTLREKGAIRLIPKFSSLMLLVIIGQFATNGLFINNGQLISSPIYLVFGIVAALPYIAVYVFERLVLEPTMIRYR